MKRLQCVAAVERHGQDLDICPIKLDVADQPGNLARGWLKGDNLY
jgi:hypothetical protein